VTIRRVTGELRGCVGAPQATCASVAEEVARVAPLAATGDRRFPKMRIEEMAQVYFEVSVLTPLEPISGPEVLDAKRYGIMIREVGGERGAILLPDIPGIETVDRQLREIRIKAGIAADAPIKIWRFEVVKYSERPH
jgi:AMMECR1 domain-containing protein